MSRNVVELNAMPDEVFAVLVDSYAFGHWVVSARRVLAEDADWPAPGSSFVHEQGAGPLRMRDMTTVLEIDVPKRLLVRARVRQIAFATNIEFVLEGTETGTRLTMTEEPMGTWQKIWNPVFDRMMWGRNSVGLERLRVLVESHSERTRAQTPPAPAERQGLPALFGAGTALAFWGVGVLRGKRVFHPVGHLYEGELVLRGDPSLPDVPLFRETGTYRALARLSRGAGLPEALPDVAGLAIKIPDRWGPGADQDLLLASSGDGAIGRRVLRPVTGSVATQYSSIAHYDIGGRHVLFGAVSRSERSFTLLTAVGTDDWREIGDLRLERRIEQDVSFDPWNTAPDVVPAGALNALRKQAYVGSRAGRESPT